MEPKQIIDRVCNQFEDVVPKESWGETSLFYNPGKLLPNGVYFLTIKEHDGANDTSSHLDRSGVYRLSIGIGAEAYATNFKEKPTRPPKGGVVSTGHNFATLNELMPHPIYAWMAWVQVLSPSEEVFDRLFPHIIPAHNLAAKKFEAKTKSIKNNK